MHFLLASATAAAVAAVRQDFSKHANPTCEPLRGCECWENKVCSSCSLSSCGIEGVKAAWPLSGGTNRLAPHLAAAYGLRDSKGRKWALKLGDQEDGGYDSSVEASQLAHRLEIYTPRVLQITEASCPGVFKSPALEEAVEEFRKSRHTALLQELVEDELPCSTSRSFWVQAGNIAMFDWLTGRNDLFNDLLKDGVAAMADNLETNQDNVVETPSHLAEIDLGFGTPCCLQDFQQILRELQEGRGHVAWVQSNVLVLLCEGKHGGLGSGSCASHFGQYNAHALRPKAWDGRLSRTQIDLGMAQTAWQALQLQGSDGWPFPNSTMDMLKRWGRRTAQDVAERLQKQEASILAELRAEKQQCCQLHCEYQGRFWRWKDCGTKPWRTIKAGEKCNIQLNARSSMLQCSPICKPGKEVRAKVVVTEGACSN
ncbi:unnamed protein product [Effrenium voratum]|uniref:Uncharacterized protein n=1 Tax=Effrenium voratum TaxID=2562239 RepID=A0AA36J1V4_9DINO|nr:unnamed protein product [Effrenium voratum]